MSPAGIPAFSGNTRRHCEDLHGKAGTNQGWIGMISGPSQAELFPDPKIRSRHNSLPPFPAPASFPSLDPPCSPVLRENSSFPIPPPLFPSFQTAPERIWAFFISGLWSEFSFMGNALPVALRGSGSSARNPSAIPPEAESNGDKREEFGTEIPSHAVGRAGNWAIFGDWGCAVGIKNRQHGTGSKGAWTKPWKMCLSQAF